MCPILLIFRIFWDTCPSYTFSRNVVNIHSHPWMSLLVDCVLQVNNHKNVCFLPQFHILHTLFYGYSPEMHVLPQVTSCLISKFDESAICINLDNRFRSVIFFIYFTQFHSNFGSNVMISTCRQSVVLM